MHIILKSRHTLPKQKSHNILSPYSFPLLPNQGLLVPLTWCQSMNPHKMMLDYREYSNSSEATEEETYSSSITPPATKRENKRISRNKRRFSDTQIKSLESMFETESRLEPVKKLELARELGLQPRQVAIWFQNKRARWKSKQLERDYNILLTNYNNLTSRFDALKREHQALLIQLQKLKDGMQKPVGHKEAANSMDSEAENADTVKNESEVKPTPSPSCVEDETGLLNLNFVEHAGGSLILPEDWGIFDSNNLFDQSTIDYQWWEFWS